MNESPNEAALAVYKEAYTKIDHILADLLAQTGIRYSLLVDRKGFVLSHKEAEWAPRPPALDSVATLVASNAAATAALANMLGERTFSEQVHQGENGTLYVESVGTEALLTLIFDGSVSLGKVKVYTKKAIAQIIILLASLKDLPPMEFGEDFQSSTVSLLDDLLGGD